MFRQFTRSMATAAQQASTKATANFKPPIQLFGLDGTYASALYTAAMKTSSIEAASKSLSSLQAVIQKDAKINEYLENPALSSQDRVIVVDTLTKSVGGMDSSVANLVKVLGENNRLDLLSSIFKQFKTLTDAHEGIVEAIVTSAVQLDSKILRRIESSIAGSQFIGDKKKKTLRLTNHVNPDILGGLVVEVGDRTVDLSIASKIAKLNQVLKEAI